jgi:lysophospholipase L1-like esterase
MNIILLVALVLANSTTSRDPADFLKNLKTEMQKEWPKNRTINIVFHGHSVPAGYFKTPVVHTEHAYPALVLKKLKAKYPYAVINVITTAIGGESSDKGSSRFQDDVMTHKPDLIFIDYALNDRRLGLEEAAKAWSSMIEAASAKNVKVILLTPTPDQALNILDTTNILHAHTRQIIGLANKYQTGIVDSYKQFYRESEKGNDLSLLMSQGNHPNEKGHELVAQEIFNRYFN